MIFVTPQYNGGYPAALKNAIDHLYAEWAGKPAMLLAYVGRGGSHRAEQLDQVCRFVKMAPLATKPALTLTHAQVKAKSGEIDPPVAFADQMVDLKQALGELQDTLDASNPT